MLACIVFRVMLWLSLFGRFEFILAPFGCDHLPCVHDFLLSARYTLLLCCPFALIIFSAFLSLWLCFTPAAACSISILFIFAKCAIGLTADMTMLFPSFWGVRCQAPSNKSHCAFYVYLFSKPCCGQIPFIEGFWLLSPWNWNGHQKE